MKIFRELYFRGSPEELLEFVKEFRKYEKNDWKVVDSLERMKDYLFFHYSGELVDKARVSIFTGDSVIKTGEISVGNIIPLEKNKLTIEEYNAVLIKFYDDVIAPLKEKELKISITQPSDDIFNPTSVISTTALEKLRKFNLLANKSEGSAHPSDQERWFDFICQTVDDERIIDTITLERFLQDESYWSGQAGPFAWDKEHALELAIEYERACNILEYYKKTRII